MTEESIKGSIGIIKQTLPNGHIVVLQYDKAERKAMGETKFRKLLAIWIGRLLKQEGKK